MNQNELVKAVADASGLPQTNINSVLKELAGVAHSVLGAGGEVTLPGLGKLSVITRTARTGRNPRTGEAIQIAEKKVPKFTASKALKDAAL